MNRNLGIHSGHHASSYEDPDAEPLRRIPTYSMSDWVKKAGEVEVFDADIHHLILNYLTINGLADAAEVFTREARLEPQMPLHCISRRKKIREAILAARPEEAIEELLCIDPSLLDKDAEVSFLLRKLQFLQLIEKGSTPAAVEFAQQRLAPCVKDCPQLLPQLEEAMALLAFNDLKCPEAQRLLGGFEQKEETARRVDDAILELFKVERVSALEILVKNVIYSQRVVQGLQNGVCPVVVNVRKGTLGKDFAPPPAKSLKNFEVAADGAEGTAALRLTIDPLQQQEEQLETTQTRPGAPAEGAPPGAPSGAPGGAPSGAPTGAPGAPGPPGNLQGAVKGLGGPPPLRERQKWRSRVIQGEGGGRGQVARD